MLNEHQPVFNSKLSSFGAYAPRTCEHILLHLVRLCESGILNLLDFIFLPIVSLSLSLSLSLSPRSDLLSLSLSLFSLLGYLSYFYSRSISPFLPQSRSTYLNTQYCTCECVRAWFNLVLTSLCIPCKIKYFLHFLFSFWKLLFPSIKIIQSARPSVKHLKLIESWFASWKCASPIDSKTMLKGPTFSVSFSISLGITF